MIRLNLLRCTMPYMCRRLHLIYFLLNYLFWTWIIIIKKWSVSSMTIIGMCYNILLVTTKINWILPLTIATCSHFGRNLAMMHLLVDLATIRMCGTIFWIQPWFPMMPLFLCQHPTRIRGSPWWSKQGRPKETRNRGSVMLRSIKIWVSQQPLLSTAMNLHLSLRLLLNRILPCRLAAKGIYKRILPLPWSTVRSIILPFFMNVLGTSVFPFSNRWLKMAWFLKSWKMLILLRVQAVHTEKRIASHGDGRGLGTEKYSRLLLCLAK